MHATCPRQPLAYVSCTEAYGLSAPSNNKFGILEAAVAIPIAIDALGWFVIVSYFYRRGRTSTTHNVEFAAVFGDK